MAIAHLLLSIVAPLMVRDHPLPPVWSPDHQVLATTKVPVAFVTPEGGNYSLLLNDTLVYPMEKKHWWFSGYSHWHTFLSDLVWSPDSRRVAFVEKVYDWSYLDPYNRDFEGEATNKRFYLTVVSRDGKVGRYLLDGRSDQISLRWQGPNKLCLNDEAFDIQKASPDPNR